MKVLFVGLVMLVAFILEFAGLSEDQSSVATAQTVMHECFGVPADYVAEFDLVDGVADGKVSYPEPRVFLEEQGQLPPPGETARHHFEHIHVGGCFPYAETWVQPSNGRTMDFKVTFHNVQDYNIASFAGGFVDANNSGGGFSANAAQKAELEAAMDASAGSTQTVFQSYTMNNIGTSCRKTFRPSLNVVRANENALVDEWFAAGQWTTYIDYAGQPICNPELQQDQLRARDWVLPSGGYLYNTILGLPKASEMALPVSGSLDFTLSGTNQDYSVYIDPDFHSHDPNSPNGDDTGIWSQDFGSVDGQLPVSVPLEGIPPGLHRLVVIADRGVIHSAIMVIPFKVAGTC